jgi:hypothetical protein
MLCSRGRKLPENDYFDMNKQRECCKVDCFEIGITEELWLEELFGETRTFQFLQHADRAGFGRQGPAGQRFGTFTRVTLFSFWLKYAQYLLTNTALFRVLPRIIILEACDSFQSTTALEQKRSSSNLSWYPSTIPRSHIHFSPVDPTDRQGTRLVPSVQSRRFTNSKGVGRRLNKTPPTPAKAHLPLICL